MRPTKPNISKITLNINAKSVKTAAQSNKGIKEKEREEEQSK